ncbi:MAG: B12-binding domain-containing radical SAM protein [Armatimonadota bacterium]
MKILLLQPPFDYYEPPVTRTESLGLGYIAAVLRRDGHDIEIIDAQTQCLDAKEMIRKVLARDFDAIGITASSAYKNMLLTTAREVRKHKKDALIFAGGYLPTLNTEKLLKACPELDFVVKGEGETVASDVIGRISRGEEWCDTPGVAYMKDGEFMSNTPPPLIQDLDSLPFPARDALKQAAIKLPALISGSRGCHHRCSFCCIHSFYAVSGSRAPRFRSPENVVDEIEAVIESTGVHDFVFVDDDFLGPSAKTHERAVRIADEIKARSLDITFSIECRADNIDEEMLNILKSAGLTGVLIGIESGVQRQLDTYNKRITVEQNKEAIELLQRSGIKFAAGFIMLDPYVTPDEVSQNMQFMRDMKLSGEEAKSMAQSLTKLKLFEGTPIVDQLRADGLVKENGLDLEYDFKDPQFKMVYKVMQTVGACKNAVNGVKGLFKRDGKG